MNREADWVAAMLAGLLILLALLAPARAEGQLPTLGETASPSAIVYRVPLVGPLIGQVQRLMFAAAWRLEAIPME
jgi:hypothetical protein